MNDPATAVMAVAFFGSVAISVRSIASAIARRSEARQKPVGPGESEIAERLGRIEAAIDVISVEVERIAEAQRFALKLSEGQGRLGRGEGRVITPH